MFLVLQRSLDDFLGYRFLSVAKDLAQCVLFESNFVVSITLVTLLVWKTIIRTNTNINYSAQWNMKKSFPIVHLADNLHGPFQSHPFFSTTCRGQKAGQINLVLFYYKLLQLFFRPVAFLKPAKALVRRKWLILLGIIMFNPLTKWIWIVLEKLTSRHLNEKKTENKRTEISVKQFLTFLF